MKRIFIAAIMLVAIAGCHRPAAKTTATTSPESAITATEVERIERVLAADDMQGRRAGTPGIEKAAEFIESEFRAAGLAYFPGLNSYRQEFSMMHPRHQSTSATINGQADTNVVVITQQAEVAITDQSGFEIAEIKAGQSLFNEVRNIMAMNKNMVILVDTSHRRNFSRLPGLRRPSFPTQATQVFVLGTTAPASFSIHSKHQLSTVKMSNIVSMLPGKSKKNEYVIFSAHYDHLGIGKPTAEGDSIYNGANDDAAGTTAVLMLSKFFKSLGDNERSLLFVAFTAEEVGGFGSQYFSRQLDPASVMAMFNIEMVGTESKWGKNSAYITGFEKTDMGAMLQKNLEGSGFTFYPDPYPQQNLFYRSDNATLARLGVPAHTISTAKMDLEKFYHSPDDEVETLDMNNMAAIIRAIAISSKGIVSGRETPSRVKN